MSRQSLEKQREDEARRQLKKLIKRGDTVYTIVRNVSRSGMSHDISVIIIKKGHDGKMRTRNVSGLVGDLVGYRQSRHDVNALQVGGAGMDMGFSVVYNLSCAMFCPVKYDHDAAYALRQEWL